MSRTYRRKNYHLTQNTSWDRKGKKLALEYTACTHWVGEEPMFQAMTKKERNQQDRVWYRDSNSGMFSVPSWFCNRYERALRMRNKRELRRYLSTEDYEPMCIARFNGAGRDWW